MADGNTSTVLMFAKRAIELLKAGYAPNDAVEYACAGDRLSAPQRDRVEALVWEVAL